jgi:hypothetical protein
MKWIREMEVEKKKKKLKVNHAVVVVMLHEIPIKVCMQKKKKIVSLKHKNKINLLSV